MISPRRYRSALWATVLATALAACSSPTPEPSGPVTIGIVAATSGPEARSGTDAIRGAQLAVDVINLAYPDVSLPLAPATGLPGLGGAKVVLVTGDTKGAPDEATRQVNALVQSGRAVAVIASGSGDVAGAIGSQIQQERVPLLDADTSADYLAELGIDWYFRLAPTDHMFTETAASLVQRTLADTANRRVGVLTEANAGSTAVVDVLAEDLANAGLSVAFRHEVASSEAGRETLRQVLRAGDPAKAPAVVVAVAVTQAGAENAAQVVAAMPNPVPLVGIGAGFAALRSGVSGPPAVLRTVAWSAEYVARNPIAKGVATLYRRRFDAAMTAAAANGFMATIALAVAIDSAHSSQPEAIRTALRQLWLSATQTIMPWNGIQFDRTGQNHLAGPIVELWDRDGFEIVFPRELATTETDWFGRGFRR